MSKLYKHRQEVTVYLTPQELRSLAVQMEQAWDEMQSGDSTTIAQWLSEELVINVAVDQQRIGRAPGSRRIPVEVAGIAA